MRQQNPAEQSFQFDPALIDELAEIFARAAVDTYLAEETHASSVLSTVRMAAPAPNSATDTAGATP